MNEHILFIDFKNSTFQFSGEQLNSLDDKYSTLYAHDSEAAIKIITGNEIDIIVTIISFDDKQCLEFLNKIRINYPRIFIVAYTTEKNRSVMQAGFRYAHQLISFPFDKEVLIKSFSRKERMSKYLHDGKLMGLINSLSDLPVLSSTYLELEDEINSKNLSFQKISKIITHDLSFTAKVLHLVNSPFFGLRNKVNDVLQAINLLGVNILKSLLLFSDTSSRYNVEPEFRNYFENLWIHSNEVGRFAEQLIYLNANKEIKMMEDAYIAGLFHDIGKIVMLSFTDYPEKIFSYMKENQTRYSIAEYKLYGSSHSEVGAYFLTLWGFPERTAEAVFLHNNPTGIDFSRFSVPSAVFIANLLVNDRELTFEKLKDLNLGVHPEKWIEYLTENNLMKEKT